ncbi:unnamed protein product [Rotaria sp. Silwood2]|nr:unnamed protein product [Rotaria sp. Silwood2]
MSSEISTGKVLLTSKPIDLRWLTISNLPETATEETIKECFERHGRVQTVKINDQRFAFVAFSDIRTASKAHHAENILDKKQLQTTFHDSSYSVPKILLEVSSSIIEPSSSSPCSITTVTNTLTDKTITTIHDDRDKYSLRTANNPEKNTRHHVVRIKYDSDSPRSNNKTSSINGSKKTVMRSSRDKHENCSSSSESDRSHNESIKIIDDYALLTFEKFEDVNKALLFIKTKSIHGIRLQAEPYNGLINEHNSMKRSICSDLDVDEYSIKATRTLYIGNLQPEISSNELREICSKFGDIMEIEIKRQQQQSHYLQTFAFIQYVDIKSVIKAMKALKSKLIRNHSVKLGFGKSQPTNVLWLDKLPSNITESMLRSFVNDITNLSSDEILDIYIDNRTYHQTRIVQCLIYFIDIIAAQQAINCIRGKRFQSKRIQVDFAISNISLSSRNQTRHNFSSSLNHNSINHKKIIQSETDKNANTERIFDWLMQNHRSKINDDEVKKYSKEQILHLKQIENKKKSNEISTSNTNSYQLLQKIFPTKNIPLESDSSFIQTDIRLQIYSSQCNQLINSICLPLPKFARILTKSSNISNTFNSKAYSKDLSFQLNNISTNKSNEDLSLCRELNERIRLLDEQIDEFNRNSCLLSPAICSENPNQTIQIERNTILNAQQTSPCHFTTAAISNSSDSTLSIHNAPTAANNNTISSTNILQTLMPASFISPPTYTNQSSSPTSNNQSTRKISSSLSDTNNNSLNILPVKLLERLDSSAKFQCKPILSQQSIITNAPISSSINDSSVITTSELITFSSTKRNQNHSPSSNISPMSQQHVTDNCIKPIVLKSILKKSCNSSQTESNETCKTTQIMSTNPVFKPKVKQTLLLDKNKKTINQQTHNLITNYTDKHQTEMKKLSKQSITSVNHDQETLLEKISKKSNKKPIETIMKSSKNVIETPISSPDSNVSQSTVKHLDPKTLKIPDQFNQKAIVELNKIQKPNLVQNHKKIEKKSLSSISIQQKKTSLSNKKILKCKQQHQNNKKYLDTIEQNSLNKSLISILKIDKKKNNQKLIINSDDNNKISKKSTNDTLKTKLKLKQSTSMYDRVKNRSRTEEIQNSLLTTKDNHLSQQNNDDDVQAKNITQLQRHNVIMDSSKSEYDMLTKTDNKKITNFDSNIFDSEENDHNNENRINQQQMEISKFDNEGLIFRKKTIMSKTNFLPTKRSSIDQLNLSSKKIKLQLKDFPSIDEQQTITCKISSAEKSLNKTISENTTLHKTDTAFTNHHDHLITAVASSNTPSKDDDVQSIPANTKQESIPSKPILTSNETHNQLINSIDSNYDEQIKLISSLVIDNTQQNSFNEQQILNQKEQKTHELLSYILVDKSTSPSIENSSLKKVSQVSQQEVLRSSSIISEEVSISTISCKTTEKSLNVTNNFLLDNTNSYNLPIDHQAVITDTSTISIPAALSDIKNPSCFSSSITNETLNPCNSRSITNHEHSSIPMRLFPQLITQDSNLFMFHHQHYSYPLVARPPSNSPPLSIRTLSTSSNNSTIGNCCYNINMSGQQYCHDKESRRDSITNSSTTSSFHCSTPNSTISRQQSFESDSIFSFGNLSEVYGYALPAQQSLNSFTSECYHINDFQSYDPYNIQWEGYIILKNNQAYIKTQFIAGNPQIARISINYWHSDTHRNLRISQRMRLEQIQLDGVQKRMQMDNDHCILIAEPNGLTPDEIRSEQSYLKNDIIQYLHEKQAAGIFNILLPGLLQPVYVVHIFPPCQFASEILQKRAPDAYRCVVQNKIEKIYLLFIITSTIQ